mmetsp:Transcript_22789/g.59299  ORF Transcript_22789/g.59299 Transcript_22789/m.59299 type:complete len:351 (+) Transcript_22789:691-1743(+)
MGLRGLRRRQLPIGRGSWLAQEAVHEGGIASRGRYLPVMRRKPVLRTHGRQQVLRGEAWLRTIVAQVLVGVGRRLVAEGPERTEPVRRVWRQGSGRAPRPWVVHRGGLGRCEGGRLRVQARTIEAGQVPSGRHAAIHGHRVRRQRLRVQARAVEAGQVPPGRHAAIHRHRVRGHGLRQARAVVAGQLTSRRHAAIQGHRVWRQCLRVMVLRQHSVGRRSLLLHGVRLVQDGDLARHEAVLAALPVVVTLDVELDHGAHRELHALELRQNTVGVDEEVTRESVRIDEAPGALEGADVAVQSTADPLAWPEQSAGGDLLGNGAAPVVTRHVELDGLSRAERRKSVLHLLGRE